PKQEGTFFGNIVMTGSLANNLGMPGVTAPAAFFCEGAGITAGVVAGRIGSGQSGAPYTNPYGANVQCQNSNGQAYGDVCNNGNCAPGQAPDGYKKACASNYCWQNGEPLTVWRNPNYVPTFDTVYAYDLQPANVSSLR